jgi:hypothetical protein
MARMRTRRHGLLPLILALGIAGCGGGGNTASLAPHVPVPAAPIAASAPQATQTHARVTLHIPSKTLRAASAFTASLPLATRRPKYIGTGTASIAVTVDNAATPTLTTLTPGSTACPTSAAPLGGLPPPLTCTVDVDVASGGQHTFTFTTYDSTDTSGNVLSTNTVTENLTANTTNNLDVTLNGVPKSVIVQSDLDITGNSARFLGNALVVAASPGFAPSPGVLCAIALDADNNPIIGPGAPNVTASVSSPSFGIGPISGGQLLCNLSIASIPSLFVTGPFDMFVLQAAPGQETMMTMTATQLPPSTATGALAPVAVSSTPIPLFGTIGSPPFNNPNTSMVTPSTLTISPSSPSTVSVLFSGSDSIYFGPVSASVSCESPPAANGSEVNVPGFDTISINDTGTQSGISPAAPAGMPVTFTLHFVPGNGPSECVMLFSDAFGDTQRLGIDVP